MKGLYTNFGISKDFKGLQLGRIRSIPYINEAGGDPYAWDGNTYSMIMDGVDEMLQTGEDAFNTSTAITLSFWMKTTSTTSLNAQVAKDSTGAGQRAWNATFRGTTIRSLFIFYWTNGGNLNTLQSTANILDDGAWHHIAWTLDGSGGANSSKLYIDGSLDQQQTPVTAGIRDFSGTGSNIAIGSTSGIGGWYNDGSIEEVALWKSALDASTISAIYNGGEPNDLLPYAPSIWWRMGDFGVWDGSDWTCPDVIGQLPASSIESVNMEEADRQADVPT